MRSKPLTRAGCLAASSALGVCLLLTVPACGGETTSLLACAGERSCPPPSNQLPWAIQILPAQNSSSTGDGKNLILAQDEAHLLFTQDGIANLRLRDTALVSGIVTDASGQPLAGAHITARLASSIPGQNDYNTSAVTSELPRGAFAMRIPLAAAPTLQPYQFWVGFDDPYLASLSPPLWRSELVTADRELPLRLRGPSDLAVVTGRINNALNEGVGNLSVQAFDDLGRLVSSTAVSQSGSGTLAGSYRLLIDPTLARSGAAFLKIVVRPGTQDPTLPVLESTLQVPLANSQSRVDFAIPSYRKPVQYQLPIRGGQATGYAVAGARVRAQVMLEDAATLKLGHKAYYTATGDSDAQGLVRITLVPAPIGGSNLLYQVAIVSPSQAPYASVNRQEIQVGPNEGLLGSVVLPNRAEIRGRLIDSNGLPVPGAQVLASRIDPPEPNSGPVAGQVLSADVPVAVADISGNFSLFLDAGDVDLEFIHPSGLQARSSLDNLRISGNSRDLGDIMLPQVTLGTLDLTSPASAPVSDAKLRIFELPDIESRLSISCDGQSPCSRTGKLRAEAFTNKSGRAQFLLPGAKVRLVSP